LDSTTISLCLSLFDWAKYKTAKGAIKLHTLLDYDGNLPAYINITNGKTDDNKGAYDIPLLKGSVIEADWFYNDFPLLNIWDSNKIFFVKRHKENHQYHSVVRSLHNFAQIYYPYPLLESNIFNFCFNYKYLFEVIENFKQRSEEGFIIICF
jgi:hypothetical protein